MENYIIKDFNKELNSYKLERKLKTKIYIQGIGVIKNCDGNIDIEELVLELLEDNNVIPKKKVDKLTIIFQSLAGIFIIYSGYLMCWNHNLTNLIFMLTRTIFWVAIIFLILQILKGEFKRALLLLIISTALIFFSSIIGVLIFICGMLIIIFAFKNKNKLEEINLLKIILKEITIWFNIKNSGAKDESEYLLNTTSRNLKHGEISIQNTDCDYYNDFNNQKINKIFLKLNKSNNILDFTKFNFSDNKLEITIEAHTSNIEIILNKSTQIHNLMSNVTSNFILPEQKAEKNLIKLKGFAKQCNISTIVK